MVLLTVVFAIVVAAAATVVVMVTVVMFLGLGVMVMLMLVLAVTQGGMLRVSATCLGLLVVMPTLLMLGDGGGQ